MMGVLGSDMVIVDSEEGVGVEIGGAVTGEADNNGTAECAKNYHDPSTTSGPQGQYQLYIQWPREANGD